MPGVRPTDAEDAYLFRHALVRDGAYTLQPPTTRAVLHRLAADIIETVFPDTGPVAAELADHLRFAREFDGLTDDNQREAEFAKLAARHAKQHYRNDLAASYWQQRAGVCEPRERAESLRLAADSQRDNGNSATALKLLEEIPQSLERPPREQAELLGSRAVALNDVGRTLESLECYDRAFELAGAAGDQQLEIKLRVNASIVQRETGRFQDALKSIESALPLIREAGSIRDEAVALTNLSLTQSALGRKSDALATLERSLELHRKNGDLRGEGLVLANLGGAMNDLGLFERAGEVFQRALEINRQVGNRRSEGNALANYAVLCKNLGRQAESIQANLESLAICREIGNTRVEGIVLGNLADLYCDEGRIEEGLALWRQALNISLKVGDRYGEGAAYGKIARYQTESGSSPENLKLLEQAIEIDRELGDREYEGVHLIWLAAVHLHLDNRELAVSFWSSGMSLLQESEDTKGIERETEAMREICARLGVPMLP